MGVSYGKIYESYSKTIEDMDNDIAMESEGSLSMGDRLKMWWDKFLALLNRFMMEFKNSFTKVLLTDKGFQKDLRMAEINRKPINGTKVYGFQYNDAYINTIYAKLTKTMKKIVEDFDIKHLDDSILIEELNVIQGRYFKEVCDVETESFNDFLKLIKEKFRGTKAEIVIMSTDLDKYKKYVGYYMRTKDIIVGDMNALKASVHRASSNSIAYLRDNELDENENSNILRAIRNIQSLNNIYIHTAHMIFELKVEEALHARQILKIMYQI